MSNDIVGNVAHLGPTVPKSKLKRINPRLVSSLADDNGQHKRARGANGSPIRSATERGLEMCSEWLVQDYGTPKPGNVNVPVLDNAVEEEIVRKFLRVVQWLYATTKFTSLKKPSAALAARHTNCSYCNCTCAASKRAKCLHCQFYPNSHAARCYGRHGLYCGNLAYIMRHLRGFPVACSETIEAVRAAFRKRPLEYEHQDGAGGYALGSYRFDAVKSKPQSETADLLKPRLETAGLLEPNLVASVFSGYEGYLLLLHDGGQLQGYGSTEEYSSLVESRLLPVYQEPEVLRQKVPLPSVQIVEIEGKFTGMTRFFHYQTTCWAHHLDEVWKNWGRDGHDLCYVPRDLIRGPKMKLGCNPIPLLGEHQYIQITLTQAFSNMPMEARGLSRRMIRDLKDPCPSHPPCTAQESPRLLTFFIIDRNQAGEAMRTAESGYIRFSPEDCKIVVDLFL